MKQNSWDNSKQTGPVVPSHLVINRPVNLKFSEKSCFFVRQLLQKLILCKLTVSLENKDLPDCFNARLFGEGLIGRG